MSLRKVCPQCGAIYGAESRFCSVDGATLVLEQPADDLMGTIVADRYHILERLGGGGMGEVFLAEHVRMKRKSALKVMREALTSDPIAVSRFHREAENASQISHPNVAAVYDFGETADGLVYIAMEYIPGEPLSQVLEEEGALNPARVGDIIAQAADALSAAHALGILHRDLKPDNIMLTTTRWGTDLVKLVDFGISRAMASATQQFTSTGMIIGTPDYMSPEQLTGDALDSRSDQYALGLIAYYALTGTFPFPAGVSKDALFTRLTSTPRPLAEARPDVEWPPSLQAALDRALALDVNQRYDEVHEFGRALEAAISEMPGTPTMEHYREALRQRFVTPTRSPSVTPPRAVHSIEATPVRPLPSVPALAADPAPALGPASADAEPLAAAPELVAGASEPLPTLPVTSSERAHPRSRRPSLGKGLTAVGATLVLVAIVLWKLAAAREESAEAQTPRVSLDSVAAPNAPTPSPVAVASLPALPLDSAVAAARSGVFTVYGDGQQGTAFLVDSIGIVLTSAELGRLSEPRIQLDPERRVIGRLMAVDEARGIAAFRIPIQHCKQCTLLRIAEDSAIRLTPGDSLIVPTPVTRAGTAVEARGAVSNATGRNLQTSLRLGERASGAPVFAADRGVVALALRRGRGQTTLVPAAALTALRQAAVRRRRDVIPNDTLVPTWPVTPVSRAELRAASARSDMPIQTYQTTGDGFAVFVMTPHVMAWRDNLARQEIQAARVMSLNDSAIRVVDAVQLWPEWDAYIAERRAVVVLHVTPELAAHGKLNRRVVTDLKRGDVADVRLFRDGLLVRPIESARMPAVVNADAYRGARQHVYSAGIAVYRPRDFAPGAKLHVEIDDARTRRSVTVQLPEAALAAVQRDLASFLR